jgi:hypothetical protein
MRAAAPAQEEGEPYPKGTDMSDATSFTARSTAASPTRFIEGRMETEKVN